MRHNKFLIGLILIFLLVGGYIYTLNTIEDIRPLGRLGFVKISNPDMYPGKIHSKTLEEYAKERGSKTAMVVHYGGDSNYRTYKEGNITIIQLAFIDKKGATIDIDWKEVFDAFLWGVPDDKWDFKANGIRFDTLEEALNYTEGIAEDNGQKGPIPMVYHGTARGGNPVISQGCGFPLYYYLIWKKYGRIAAYYYGLQGIIFPYFNLPTWRYELKHASELQELYTSGQLDLYE